MVAAKQKYYWGTGRRKTAVARVRLKEGPGRIVVNGRKIEEYFPLERTRELVFGPLIATKAVRTYDVWARLDGGGITGQAGALAMGIGRALVRADAEFAKTMRDGGFLTRDSRMVERKKFGHKKARRSFQYSKR